MLSEKEKQIIEKFLENLDKYDNKVMTLKWSNKGEVIAEFDTCFEDANDFNLDDSDDKFEEYISFAFDALQISGSPPISINHHNNFLINYHNFPDEILVDGKKIN